MTADAQGNDLERVGVVLTGLVAIALDQDTPTFLADADVTLEEIKIPEGYNRLGLIKQDGAPQSSREDGDTLEFWQDGYEIGSGTSETIACTAAERSALVRQLIRGVAPDAKGKIVVTGDIPAGKFPLIRVVKYKNGMVNVRNGMATLSTYEEDQETRGENAGVALTFKWMRDESIGGLYYEWELYPDGTTTPAVLRTGETTADPKTGGK